MKELSDLSGIVRKRRRKARKQGKIEKQGGEFLLFLFFSPDSLRYFVLLYLVLASSVPLGEE